MQNRYTGDIGDFGKLGLLGCLRDLSIGVNWYLTPDETHNGDGRHVGYLEDKRYRACDELLWYRLSELVREGKRDTSELESLLPAVFYRNELNTQKMKKAEREIARMAWHADALKKLRGCDLVFLDPDNGLMVPSAGAKSNKYVKPEEIVDYYAQGSSICHVKQAAGNADIVDDLPLRHLPTRQRVDALCQLVQIVLGVLHDFQLCHILILPTQRRSHILADKRSAGLFPYDAQSYFSYSIPKYSSKALKSSCISRQVSRR